MSLALRGDKRISEVRRTQINKKAKELGYIPNPMITALMTNLKRKTKQNAGTAIAFVYFNDSYGVFKVDPFMGQLLKGCKKRLSELGYQFTLMNAKDVNKRYRHYNRVLSTRQVAGVLIPSVPLEIHPELLDFSNLSAVKLGYTCPALLTHRVVPYHSQAIRHTIRELKNRGYKRLGFFFAATLDRHTNEETVAIAMRHNLESKDSSLPIHFYKHEDPDELLRDYVRTNKPDVIISDEINILTRLEGSGIRVPEDVEFCCINIHESDADVAGFFLNTPLVGEEMVNFIDSLIRQNKRGLPESPLTLKISGKWIGGRTLRQ